MFTSAKTEHWPFMKIILPFLFLIFTHSVFGQAEIERLTSIPANTKPFGQKFKVEYHGNFKNHKFVSIKDSVTGNQKVVPNKGQLDTPSEYSRPLSGQFCIYFSETTPPPLLDSLPDGLYAFYYTPFPYADKDTIKMRSDAIYALIPVKNFQVNGTVKWYYPNGNLAQQSEYLDNRKNGLTIVNTLDVSNTRIVLQEQKNYHNNMEEGPFSTIYNKPIEKEEKLLATIPFLEQGTKVNGKHTGNYSITMNGETFISGTFKDGKPVDHWVINQWTIKGKKLVLQPNMEFEVNDEKKISFGGIISRNLTPFEDMKRGYYSYSFELDRKNYASHWLSYMSITSLVENWDSESYYSGKNRFESLSVISVLQNCLGLLDQNTGKMWNGKYYYPSLIDSTGKSYTPEDLKTACGTLYDFKAFKCYYPNGKLYFDFDFEDNQNIAQSPVYRPNGKLLNEVVYSEKDRNYHYIQYDSTGRVESESVYGPGGKFLKSIDFSEKRIIDGDTLSSLRESDWFFYRSEAIDSTLNKDFLQMLEIDYKTDQILKSHYYNPVTRSGKYYEFEMATSTARTINYQYIESYDSVYFTGKYNFFDLETSFRVRIPSRSGMQFYLPDLEYYNIHILPEKVITKNGQPVNAKFQLKLDNSGKLKKCSYNYKNGIYRITLPQQDYPLFNELLNTIDYHLKITEVIEDEIGYRLDEENKEKAELKTLLFNLKDGLMCDSVIKKSINNYFISKYFISNDSLVKYNHFDQWYNAFNRGYASDNDFKQNWISEILSSNDLKETQLMLDFDSKGDTTYYYFEDRIHKIKEVYNRNSDEIKKWNAVDGNIKQYFIKYPHKDYFVYNQEKQICKYYNKDSSLNTEFLIKDDLLTKISHYDKQGMLAEETFVKNGYATENYQYYNGFLVAKIKYYEIDSVIPDLDRLPNELDPQLVRYYLDTLGIFDYIYNSPRNYQKQGQRDEVTKYQNDQIVETGTLTDNRKSGNWNYDYPNLPKFQMEFHDTSYRYERRSEYKRKSYYGNYRQFDSVGKVYKSGTFYEFSSEYICTNQDYTEQYQVQYDTWNYESTNGKSIHVVNYYPNGNKMNEGTIVNGKPEGLWLWYHSDGLLYEIGKYKLGIRDGRWLSGDLSKLRFTGELCLDPNAPEFKELMSTITVFVEYYEDGLVSYSESHELGTE